MCPGLLETRWYAQRGIPAYAYGPGALEVAHQADEHVEIPRLLRAVEIYVRTAHTAICIALLYSLAIEDLAVQLERRLAQLTQLLRAQAHRGRSVGSLLVLARLDAGGPQRVTDLAAAERVAQPTMTGLIGRLEADGLVRKTADPADARAVRVELTDAGRDQLAAVRAERAEALQARLDLLDDDARAALAAALPALDRLIAT